MNKKNLVATTLFAGIILAFGGLAAYSHNMDLSQTKNTVTQTLPTRNNDNVITSDNTIVLRVLANHAVYTSVEELESNADLIVVGKTIKDFDRNKPFIRKNPKSRGGRGIAEFYTITPFEVKKVLKGSGNGTGISLIQPAVLIDQSNKQEKRLLILDDYTLLKKNSSYLLYLAKTDGGMYGVLGVSQGKFNLDKTDKEEEEFEAKDEQYKELKAKVLEKNKAELNQ
jgi:hypothetical protein